MISDDFIPVGADTLPNGMQIDWRWMGGSFYADALWTADLDEDEEIGWKFPGAMLEIRVMDGGKCVALGDFSYLAESHGRGLTCFNIFVLEDRRRKGIATAIYDRAEMIFGDSVRPYPGNEGGAISDFWISRLQDQPHLLAEYADDIGGNAPALTRHG